MCDSTDGFSLGAEFPAASYADWRALAERAIEGARFEDRLESRTADNLTIEPLYRRAETAPPSATRAARRWQVLARVDHPDPAAANAQALHELANGADGLLLVGAGAPGAHGFGLPGSPETIARVVRDIQYESGAIIEFELGLQTRGLPLALATLIERRGLAPESVHIRFGFDYFGPSVVYGGFPLPWSEFAPAAARLAADLSARGFKRALMVADGRVVHNAVGTEAQELAYTIAAAVAFLRAFDAHGIALDEARRLLFFRLTADTNQFMTIAKFRALRALWRRVEEACELEPEPIFISAETAWRTMTRDDPFVNILRATIATFAAGVGGADAITVLPFTLARGLPDRFARRIARNTSLVLLDEANIAAVADPTAGTGWSEDLTDKLCRAAWELFQEIEMAGGLAAALEQGLIQREIANAGAARQQALMTRSDILVGANQFRDASVADVPVLDVAPEEAQPAPIAVAFEPLRPVRLAEPFEMR
jgi:methylmalonyl-CoA mutase